MLEQREEKNNEQLTPENNELRPVSKIFISNENKDEKETEDLYFPYFVLGYN
jgi:hypothetical protein